MKDQQGDIATIDSDQQRNSLIKRAILDLLLSHGTQPDATIDIIRAEHESRCKGISKIEFSRAMMQLLELGVIEMRDNAFHLTKVGFKAYQQDNQVGQACDVIAEIGGTDGTRWN